MLSDGMILYIGGIEIDVDNTSRQADINQINLYNTKLASWSVVACI